MAGNQINERLIGFRCYDEGNDLLGLVNVTLPEIEAMSDTVSGAGIAGEVESPVLGHYAPMTTTFAWRTIEKSAMKLAQQKAHQVDLRGSQQVYDSANGTYSSVPVRLTMRIVPKTVTLGTFEAGATTETEIEYEVLYIKGFIEGKEVMEIDKFNFISKFGDVDALASVRSDLGLN